MAAPEAVTVVHVGCRNLSSATCDRPPVAERPGSAVRSASVELLVRGSHRAGRVCRSGWIHLMASMATGRTCRQVKRDHGLPRSQVWNFQVMPKLTHHDAGSGRPVATEVI